MIALTFSLIAAAAGLAYAIWCGLWVLRQDEGGAELRPPYLAIREGANAFIRTQYLTILAVGVLLLIILWITPQFGFLTALGFAIGGLCSAISGIVGMWVAVRANVRTTTAAARQGLPLALQISLRSGAVTGFLVGALALASVSGFYLLLYSLNDTGPMDLRPLAGLGFGASLVSIFARLGGGIFTKAADVGADLVGKIEQGIPEDDPRNPAVIADNVGDNVGDCAGMAADIFESYAVTLVAAMLVASVTGSGENADQVYPLVLGGVALFASMIGIHTSRLSTHGTILSTLIRAVLLTIVLSAAGFYLASHWMPAGATSYTANSLFASALTGLAVGIGMVATTTYFTGTNHRPVQEIARASRSGHATNIIAGLSVGMESTLIPTLVIAAGVIAAYAFAGIFGIAIATVALLSLTPVVVAIDAYGPVTDNAGGIAEMAHLPEEVRQVTDELDAAGNSTKSLTKVFAIGSAGLAALALFGAFKLEFGSRLDGVSFAIDNPYILAGLFIGALLPFIFSGIIFKAVGKAAASVVEEVREQFKAHPEILTGERLPDYARAVRMLTRASIRGMILPGLLPVIVPLLVAFAWTPFGPHGSGAQLMGGILIGAVISGLILALMLSTGGAAWDNAKKYIEAGHYGGKGSPAHMAAITGDTVGDPCKDTAGPAINPMRKVLSLMALLLVPFL
ncbi:MAG TPA: sodium-translocating pyrophosphatase [Chromatiales bacterium]|nr:sodium-translocating pyrophosphatase [Chromatiales bacterium]HEX21854.1 sodium-translocating pyrophosphatase [Chromatiales bacterium]